MEVSTESVSIQITAHYPTFARDLKKVKSTICLALIRLNLVLMFLADSGRLAIPWNQTRFHNPLKAG